MYPKGVTYSRTKPKNWMLRKYFKSLLKPADIGRSREISSFVSFVRFFKEKDILEFPLEKRCKRKRKRRMSNKRPSASSPASLLAFNFQHNAPGDRWIHPNQCNGKISAL